ncbi:MAG: GNAT family N-acetyltransferase [Betaproteobacteria bacterium]
MASTAPTTEEIRRLEELTLATSPAIHQWLYDGWVLRASGNDVRRANSATAFYPSSIALAEKIAVVEEWYRQRGQGAMFRLNELLTPSELDGLLEQRGYTHEMDTFMMTLQLSDTKAEYDIPAGLRVIERSGIDGIADIHQLKGSSATLAERDATRQSLWRGPERYLALKSINGLLSCGMARVQNGHVGIFTMRTAEKSRSKGYATLLVAQLLAWGRSLGAHTAFLQVDQSNEAAISVYRRFGFAPRYGYWQRVQAVDRVHK